MVLETKRSKVSHTGFTRISRIPNFNLICCNYKGQPFSSYRPFGDKCINDPNMTRTLRVNTHLICILQLPLTPNFKVYFIYVIRFRDTGHFMTNAPNDPKMILNTTRSKVSHTHSLLRFTNFDFHFALWPAVFKLDATLTQVHRMTSKWPWIIRSTVPQICVILYSKQPETQISIRFALRQAVFWVTGPFWGKYIEWPGVTLNTKCHVSHVCHSSTLSPSFQSGVVYGQPFQRVQAILR